MGGTSRAAVAALVVPPDRAGLAEEIIDGAAAAATAFGCPLVGGDTTGGPVVMMSIAVLGTCAQTGPVLRRGAQLGDAVWVCCVELDGAARDQAGGRGRFRWFRRVR
jgi:thiamine-monophosphate kinase